MSMTMNWLRAVGIVKGPSEPGPVEVPFTELRKEPTPKPKPTPAQLAEQAREAAETALKEVHADLARARIVFARRAKRSAGLLEKPPAKFRIHILPATDLYWTGGSQGWVPAKPMRWVVQEWTVKVAQWETPYTYDRLGRMGDEDAVFFRRRVAVVREEIAYNDGTGKDHRKEPWKASIRWMTLSPEFTSFEAAERWLKAVVDPRQVEAYYNEYGDRVADVLEAPNEGIAIRGVFLS